MVLMALDHARDFLSYPGFPPEDMAHTNGALFFTRFVTHFCAPVFAFLAGTGAYLSTSRGKSRAQVSRFFLSRGLWLVLLELTVVDFAWGFVAWAHAGVIWGLGWSMVVMALIVFLPVRWIGVLGLGMIATHNLLDRIAPASFGTLSWLWIVLHTPGHIPVTADFQLSVRYVLIPWVGVMAAGFAFGSLLLRPDRRKWILTLGVSATALFLALRLFNAYGNGIAGLMPFGFQRSAGPWSVQRTLSLTVVSFFNTLKYPPSLDYLLMTLGPGQSRTRAESHPSGLRPRAALLLCPTSISHSHPGYLGCVGLSSTCPARLRDCRRCDETCRVWSCSAFYLLHVACGGGNSLPALPVVYGIPKSASGLDLAQLSVTGS
jgi:uncharacterized membrane protein